MPGESLASEKGTTSIAHDTPVEETWFCQSRVHTTQGDPKLKVQCETATNDLDEDYGELGTIDLRAGTDSIVGTAPRCKVLGQLNQANERLEKANDRLGRILDRSEKYITWFLFFMGEQYNIREADQQRKKARRQLIEQFKDHGAIIVNKNQKQTILKIKRDLKRDAGMGPVLSKKREKRQLEEIFNALKKRHNIVKEIVESFQDLTRQQYCSELASVETENSADTP